MFMRRLWLIFAQTVTVCLAILFLVATLRPQIGPAHRPGAEEPVQYLTAIPTAEIYTHYGTSASTAESHVRSEIGSRLRFAHPNDVVIAAVGETVEDVGKAVAWLGDGPVAVHDDCFFFRHSQNPKFIAYCMQTAVLNSEKEKYVSRAKVKRLSDRGLEKLTIPVPPIDEQRRIVEILDKFDALVNDLSIGLPAELAARRRQYEYYRDKLLTFREAAS